MKTLTIIIFVLVMLGLGQALAKDLSPMMMEIEAAMEATKLEIADLKLQYEAAVSDEQAMEIMREVARVKREGRVELMRIQLRHAGLAGNDELVLQLEEIIAKMMSPPVKGTPVPRPAPQQ